MRRYFAFVSALVAIALAIGAPRSAQAATPTAHCCTALAGAPSPSPSPAIMQSALEQISPAQDAGSATSTFYALSVTGQAGNANCTGPCQPYPNVLINEACITSPFSSVFVLLYNNSHQSGIAHTGTPGTAANMFQHHDESSNCGTFLSGLGTGWTNALTPRIIWSDANAASYESGTVITPSNFPSGGFFMDQSSLDYQAPQNMFEICDGCGSTWATGGSLNKSILNNYTAEINNVPSILIMFNGLSIPGGTTFECSVVAANHCTGDQYNLGTYDSRVRLDELCNNLGQANLKFIRQEVVLTAGDLTGITDVGLGRTVTTLLNTLYWMQNSGTNCAGTGLVIEQNDAANVAGRQWMAPAMWAIAAMAPSSDGKPDAILPQTYVSNCPTVCSPVWPEQLIQLSAPQFTTSAYSFCGGTCTSAHSATFTGSGCSATGGPVKFGSESGGVFNLVGGCAGTNFPILYAPYGKCNFLGYPIGPCEWVLNTSSTTSAALNGGSYNYSVSFNGQYFGNASGTLATLFSWLSNGSAAYTALSTQQTRCTDTTGCNGTISFGAVPSTIAAAGSVGSAVLLVTNKPPGY